MTRRRTALTVGLAATLLAALATGCSSGDDIPTNARTSATAPRSTTDASVRLQVRESAGGALMTARIASPRNATEMQIGLDPGFVGDTWQPVTDRVTFPVDAGYQQVFARFRTGPDDSKPVVVVAGLDVDLAAKDATANPPRPAAIGLATPTQLVVDLEVGRVIRESGGDHVDGATVDPAKLDSGWSVTDADGTKASITATERDTVPIDTAHDDAGEPVGYAVRHRITLTMSTPLALGVEHRLRSPLGTTTAFTVDDHRTVSPAVHANQVGYRPGDTAKTAFLTTAPGSTWPTEPPAFHVVAANGTDVATSVYEGVATRRSAGDTGKVGKGDLTGLDVWQLDFSTVTAPGRYRVCVDGIGCSAPFSIDDDSTWMRVATTVARALFHQRSGIALGEPTTSFQRPRPDHPDDGLVVHESSLTALEAADLPDDQLFRRLVAGATDTVVKTAWGGHFDAGDWDRRTQHLFMARTVLDLARIAPDRFATHDLDIPESGNAVPDIVDEALWTVDLFRRMQRADGAVRGGIEGAQYPTTRTTSWRDDIARYAYAPDPWTTYTYAGVAADAAVFLRTIDPARAETYAASARSAMTWAEAQKPQEKYAERITAQRAVAAASMLRLTGDRHWNDVFVESTPFGDGPQSTLGCNAAELCDAAWNYLWVDPSVADPAITANVRESYRLAATRSADASDSTLFRWCLEDPDVPLIWGLGVGGAPHAMTLLRAWILTGDARFRDTAERCASVSLGANPLNTSYITGLGSSPVRHPLIVDVNAGALPAWPGTPVYGNHVLGGDTQWVIDYRLKPAGATGNLSKVPYLQSWYDLSDVGPMDEFTVYQSHGPAMWVFGVLASRSPNAPA